MQQPNACFFCEAICPRVICDGCLAGLAAQDALAGKVAGLVADGLEALKAPLVADPGIDHRIAAERNPGVYNNCACGKIKARKSRACRECVNASKYHPCPEILATGLRCGVRCYVGKSCGACREHLARYGRPRGGGRAVVVFAVAPDKTDEASRCARELLASLAGRLTVSDLDRKYPDVRRMA